MSPLAPHTKQVRPAPLASRALCSVQVGTGTIGRSYALNDRTPFLFGNGPEVKA